MLSFVCTLLGDAYVEFEFPAAGLAMRLKVVPWNRAHRPDPTKATVLQASEEVDGCPPQAREAIASSDKSSINCRASLRMARATALRGWLMTKGTPRLTL